jgi:hypothetical protein
MRIFIDESGTFLPGNQSPGLSLVGALIIPDERFAWISRKYGALRAGFPKENGEVKGRLLAETQIAQVVDLLRRNDVLLELVAVDLDANADSHIEAHKSGQARGMTSLLTETDQPWLSVATKLGVKIAALPNQLYVQSVAMVELVWKATEHAIDYYAQRRPKELSSFHWTIDGKDKNRQTNWETLWAEILVPMLESKSTEEAMRSFGGGDFRYMRGFFTAAPGRLPKPPGADGSAINIQKLLMDNFRYSSAAEMGLELVDILVNATRRALVGNLRPQGWIDIPTLMIHRNQQYIRFIAFHDRKDDLERPYFPTLLLGFAANGRNLHAPRFL